MRGFPCLISGALSIKEPTSMLMTLSPSDRYGVVKIRSYQKIATKAKEPDKDFGYKSSALSWADGFIRRGSDRVVGAERILQRRHARLRPRDVAQGDNAEQARIIHARDDGHL